MTPEGYKRPKSPKAEAADGRVEHKAFVVVSLEDFLAYTIDQEGGLIPRLTLFDPVTGETVREFDLEVS